LFVGTDSTWLWRQNVGDRFFYKFWGQGIRAVARKDEMQKKRSWLEVRPVRAQPGEEAQIELMAYDQNGAPRGDPTIAVQIQAPGGGKTLTLNADPAMKGRYTGKHLLEKAGEYRVTWTGEGSGPVEAKLRVLLAPEELRQPNVNMPTLELLGARSGGLVVKLYDLASVHDRLKGETKYQVVRREATIWDN